jgi:hypothetical protein
MSMYELEIGWAHTAAERRYLHWELLACDEVRGVFLTARDEVLAVLFDGGPREFHDWASTLAALPADSPHLQTNQKGASQ